MKKIVSLALSIIMASAVAGCSYQRPPLRTTTTSQAAGANVTDKTAGTVDANSGASSAEGAASADANTAASPAEGGASADANTAASPGKDAAAADVHSSASIKGPTGIVAIEEWKALFPAQVASFELNKEMVQTTYGGSVQVDYLEKYPFLKFLYAGFGFSKQYDRARGHIYALEDVLSTARPKKGASCFACKSSQFDEALKRDIAVSSANFAEFGQEHINVGMTCYDCHAETPGTIVVDRNHLMLAFTNSDTRKDLSNNELACAQCHVEYYMTTEENDVRLPWSEGLGCEEAFAYYEKLGFADWVHPETGASLLKAQHPETETFEGSPHEKAGLDCTTCHMPSTISEGKTINSHHWGSPLKTVESSCLRCHTNESAADLTKHVEDIQKSVYDKTLEVGESLAAYIEKLTAAIQSATLAAADLEDLRHVHREAQFYWDYVFVENGEGFHNTEKQLGYLEHAQTLIDEALKKLPS